MLGLTVKVGLSGCDDSTSRNKPSPNDSAELQQALQQLANDEVKEAQVPGLGITVELADGRRFEVNGGKVGPLPGDASYEVTTTQQIVGSTTKLFTATMIMQLIESDKLSLDQTVDRWFSIPNAQNITVRMLLSHTSGLHDYTSFLSEEETRQPHTPQQLVDVAVAQGPWAQPGDSVARYSNTNFTLLALILERETGMSWEDNVHARITQPLGLTHTFSATKPAANANVAKGWVLSDDGWVDGQPATDPSIGWGVGAIVSTNHELFTFTKALLTGKLFKSPNTLALMRQYNSPIDPALLSDGEPPYTVGLCLVRYQVDDMQIEGHVGHILGYNSATFRDIETGTIVTVTSNVEHEVAGLTAVKIAQYLRSR